MLLALATGFGTVSMILGALVVLLAKDRADLKTEHRLDLASQRDALNAPAADRAAEFQALIAQNDRLADRLIAPDAARARLFPEMQPREQEEYEPPVVDLQALLEAEIAGE